MSIYIERFCKGNHKHSYSYKVSVTALLAQYNSKRVLKKKRPITAEQAKRMVFIAGYSVEPYWRNKQCK